MKVHLQRVEAASSDHAAADGSMLDEHGSAPDAGEWSVVEETDGGAARPPANRLGWRLYAAIALAGAVVVAGIVGRTVPPKSTAHDASRAAALSPGSAEGPDGGTSASDGSALTITSPAEGAAVDGALVRVRAVASRPIGPVRLDVDFGGVTIGWTTVDVAAAGPLSVSIPVFAPPVTGRVELVASLAGDTGPAETGAADGPLAARRSFWLRPLRAVGFWQTAVVQVSGTMTVVLSGCAPLTYSELSFRVGTRDGRPLGNATAVVTRDDTLPGSAGGHALGSGSFWTSIVLSEAVDPGTTLRLELDWHDDAIGLWGASWLSLVVPGSPDRDEH